MFYIMAHFLDLGIRCNVTKYYVHNKATHLLWNLLQTSVTFIYNRGPGNELI